MADPDEPTGQDPDLASIGEVINLLREEFPDVSISKVRFLESQGLLAPARSDGGYRMFDRSDLERLRFILRQQRDHFLPLKVIKSKLTLWERGEDVEGGDPTVVGSGLLEVRGEPVAAVELLRRSGLTTQQLAELVDHGLIADAQDGVHTADDLAVANEARRLLAQGLEARHLRSVRHAAEREADLVARLSAPLLRVRNPEGREQARDTVEATGDSIVALHRAFLAAELRRLFE